jgi:hypothetical protein
MSDQTSDDSIQIKRRSASRTIAYLLAGASCAYLLVAYLILPLTWRGYESHHPGLTDAPELTHTANGIPGDPLNVGLVGSESEIQRAMLAAKWYPADPITLESSLRIAADVVFDRSYKDAPVSSLYLWGRKQDLAFEQPIGSDPRRRHHVRFWRSKDLDAQGEPLWLGSATLDTHVGLSDTTAQITHHISPDVDLERDKVIDDIRRVGDLARVYWIDKFHKELQGKNGGGDPWHTDGKLAVGVIKLQNSQ